MKTTVSVIKADTGSIGGHNRPSDTMLEKARERITMMGIGTQLLIDGHVFFVGDDIILLMTHTRGIDNTDIHKFAWDTFIETTAIAKKQGLYGAGQDLLKDSFSGNVRGMGPGSAEMEFEERQNEPFILFMADKTSPGVFNYPVYSAFADPFHNAGLLLAPDMKGFTFVIMDVRHDSADKVITLNAPEDLYDIATLLRDTERFVIESIWTKGNEKLQAASVSTSRLHNIAGKYTGKDDPVALIRSQKQFPSTGEILSPYATAHFILGDNRGSHHVAVMPVPLNSIISYFDGPTIMQAAGFCIHEGRLTEPVDLFDQPFWDVIRRKAAQKTMDIRQQGFFNPAMGPMEELEYTGVVENIKRLEARFTVRS